jgi:acetylglutamate kinase
MTINESTAAALAAGKSPDEWKEATQKAATLAEALPWLKEYHGKTYRGEDGGNAMKRQPQARLRRGHRLPAPAGFRPVVVHGGAPQISRCWTGSTSSRSSAGGYG